MIHSPATFGALVREQQTQKMFVVPAVTLSTFATPLPLPEIE